MNINKTISLCVSSFLIIVSYSECAKILGVWPLIGSSHYILGNRLMRTLADVGGHDVTLISPFEDKVPPKNGSYRSIVLDRARERLKGFTNTSLFELNDLDAISNPKVIFELAENVMDVTLSDVNVQKLMKSGAKFDVVIIEQFGNEALKALAHHFNAHLIIFTSFYATEWVNDFVGNPSPVAYVPQACMSYPTEMSLLQRAHSSVVYLLRRLIFYLYLLPKQEIIKSKYFPNAPKLQDIISNTSLVLLNSHESISQARPLVPNMIQIGGYHVQSPKPLPDDLQRILDEAEEGVILFSMGTLLKADDFPASKRNALAKAFSKLKQTVIWKWDNDSMFYQPDNVILRKWLPQSDMLAHPNLKLFINHAGLLGTTEAIYHGVPVLSIPVFGDQYANALYAQHAGYGLALPYKSQEFNENKLLHLITELIQNPKYRRNAQYRSKLFHNRPMTPAQTLNYWVEYVIETGGAHHLKVLGIHFPWYKYYLVDAILLLISISAVPLFALRILLKRIFRKQSCEKLKKS